MNSLSERSRFILAVVLLVLAILLLSVSVNELSQEFYQDSCLHPADLSMGIYIGECVYEGYDFSQCYYEYTDFLHGGEVLEMPVTWV